MYFVGLEMKQFTDDQYYGWAAMYFSQTYHSLQKLTYHMKPFWYRPRMDNSDFYHDNNLLDLVFYWNYDWRDRDPNDDL